MYVQVEWLRVWTVSVHVGLSLMRLVTGMWVFKISAARDLIEHDLS